MTTTDTEVTQADRAAAWRYRPACYKHYDETKWMNGHYDNAAPVIKAFARHRTLTPAQADVHEAVKQARHDERMKFAHKPCRHTTTAENETERADLHQWQTDQHEWFDATILEIVSEYAAWRDKQEATPAQAEGRVLPLELLGTRCKMCGTSAPHALSRDCNRPECEYRQEGPQA